MRSFTPWPLFPSSLEPDAKRSFSLQFIILELLASFTLLEELSLKAPRLEEMDLPERLSFLSREVEKFLLFSLHNPFDQVGGILDKLCFYCETLLQASLNHFEEPLSLLEEMRTLVLQMKSKLILWKKESSPSEPTPTSLFSFTKEMGDLLPRFFTSLSPAFEEAKGDENVLFLLLEKREELNRRLAPRSVEKLLDRLFPAGKEHLKVTLEGGYGRRGFIPFFEERRVLIEALEWEEQ